MSRKQELLKIFDQIEDTKDLIMPMIDDVVFLEQQLQDLRKLPFIRVNDKDPALQKPTPAAKQYKELLDAGIITAEEFAVKTEEKRK